MDPHATNDFVTAGIVRQTYRQLVGLDNAMELEPGVATAWAPVDPSTWRFTIRQGVTFHDGSPMTAEDVAFSIMRQKEAPLYKALYGGIKRPPWSTPRRSIWCRPRRIRSCRARWCACS